MRPGPKNLITDVTGLTVGNAEDARVRTGVTVLLADRPAIAAVDIRGGAPGTRGTAALALDTLVDRADAVVLSGGSEFGLDAPGAVVAALAAQGRGFVYGGQRVPIVPGAILFDLLNGGDKDWGEAPPYRNLAREALGKVGSDFALGNTGAGYGATAGPLKGGLGSASVFDPVTGYTVGALAGVNPHGSTVVPGSDCFWAAPFSLDNELGNQAFPQHSIDQTTDLDAPSGDATNTIIAAVATDAVLTGPQAQRMAIMAQDGLARAVRPAHTPYDGDVVFALSTEKLALSEPAEAAVSRLGAMAADTLARAIARGVYEAEDMAPYPSYRSAHGARG